jgi:hypothetical protein
LSKTLPYYRVSYRTITLNNYIYILDKGIIKGLLVGRDYIPSKGQVSKAESDEKEGGANTLNLYTTPVPPQGTQYQ